MDITCVILLTILLVYIERNNSFSVQGWLVPLSDQCTSNNVQVARNHGSSKTNQLSYLQFYIFIQLKFAWM